MTYVAKKEGYTLEYCYNQDLNGQTGYIVLIGKNSQNRQARNQILNIEQVQNFQPLQPKTETIPKDYTEIQPENLNEIQKLQLTYHWRENFGPGYTLSQLEAILDDESILKTIMTDKFGNVIAGCTGEIDGLGGLEITEFFF
jgi:hypothetical protein